MSWQNEIFLAFDLETSGAYPVGNDIVEFAGVRWQNGKIVDELQFLAKPREPMTDFIVGIHGITNEMVAHAPPFRSRAKEVAQFFEGAIPLAHHAPFDMGFLSWEFENTSLALPKVPSICTSLLSQRMIPESKNHKLQTLIRFLNLEKGLAHRAKDDAVACLNVGLECFRRIGEEASLEDIYKKQGGALDWNRYALLHSRPVFGDVAKAIETKGILEIMYKKAGIEGERRQIKPIGIARNPDGDWIQALCLRDHVVKRFYVDKIIDWCLITSQ